MNGTNNNRLYSFEENEKLYAEIEKILSEGNSTTKLRRLKSLKMYVNTPLAQSHIDYYIKKLRKTMRDRFARLVCTVISTLYLLFTLYRVYLYYHPEKNPFPETNNTVSDVIMMFYLLPVFFIAYFIIKKALQKLNLPLKGK